MQLPTVGQGQVILYLALSGVPALAVLLPLTRRAERPPVSWLWMACMPLALELVHGLAPWKIDTRLPIHGIGWVSLAGPYATYLSLAPVVVAVCWTVTDIRPLAAITLEFLLYEVLLDCLGSPYGETWTQMTMITGLPLALTCALVWLLRHRVRTGPPTIS